ncbi:hypothetical protein J6590_068625 [Homalodisca vitripennis]|nr:hypothetical protein J6590_068625 [Homalodisca vitripennis]
MSPIVKFGLLVVEGDVHKEISLVNILFESKEDLQIIAMRVLKLFVINLILVSRIYHAEWLTRGSGVDCGLGQPVDKTLTVTGEIPDRSSRQGDGPVSELSLELCLYCKSSR